MPEFHRFDPQIQTEDIAFRQEELIVCECGRASAPTRTNCLYCGKTLGNPTAVAVGAASLEPWENGFNVVDASTIPAMPIARVATGEEAETLSKQRVSGGVRSTIVADAEIGIGQASTRLASIGTADESLTLTSFNDRSVTEIDRAEIVLVVAGTILRTRTESIETRGLRSTTTTLDESETDSRERIVDVYSKNDRFGFRILPAGFDFSVLGDEKEFVAEKNLAKLIELLRSVCPNVRVIDEYDSLKSKLDAVWPVESRTDGLGRRSVRFGKSGMAKATTTSNLEQFTRFSRLQWHAL